MDYFSEEHSKLLLNKEWLVKVDTDKSVPYLLKVYCSTVDLSCCVVITDTKHVWGEVLSSKQMARRWRDCNSQSPSPYQSEEDEDAWRSKVLKLISSAHTLGGITDLSFEVIDSHFSDLAFELVDNDFKWRWETYSLGPLFSAEVLSKHLIMPLISVIHLAFSSADPVSELSETDLEKAIDKIGRTARRTVDTHVKHAMSKPRVATCIRRMTATFNFSPELPPVSFDAISPDLSLPSVQPVSRGPVSATKDSTSLMPAIPIEIISVQDLPPHGRTEPGSAPASETMPTEPPTEESETEPESGSDELPVYSHNAQLGDMVSANEAADGSSHLPPRLSPDSILNHPTARDEDAGSSPPLPSKRRRHTPIVSSEDDDSEAERKRRAAQSRLSTSIHRGTKQPVKRGGKRF
ncbi:uncharacterized protein LAESUDRAFT_698304 [Laetiporus sulphureus 93-53]|uniref:XLF-like N-terminal domain-containing protein n=1 Tax=Laetiporus sulphureus 93-53 TaxID=1314785 RepID=A0A165ERW5_9APHY|nr:uncharacterized protein LAESUDRAFT_698304 [Laetiporus sulphureus 93-53]KZT07641.1 hypothetical protein LAESUDRAFT_698304 [Laetiporus sulphureus 93-53]